ncbi:hypothetical protein C7401_12646 [Paraburkholderia unamae]|nr:hypothetical protein C7401_12646 [Paraburkholderia unamae]
MSLNRQCRIGCAVMVCSTSVDTESADGMRGRISAIEGDIATVECYLGGDSCVLRMPLGELVSLNGIAS